MRIEPQSQRFQFRLLQRSFELSFLDGELCCLLFHSTKLRQVAKERTCSQRDDVKRELKFHFGYSRSRDERISCIAKPENPEQQREGILGNHRRGVGERYSQNQEHQGTPGPEWCEECEPTLDSK